MTKEKGSNRTMAALGIGVVIACVSAPTLASDRASNVVCLGCVGTSDLATGAVTAPKLRDQAVTTAKLRNKAVNRAKLKNNTVTSVKIKDDSVSAADLADEPGVDFNSSSTSVTLTSTEQTVRSITMTLPRDGFVTCMDNSQIYFGTSNSDGEIYFGWEMDGVNDSSMNWWDNVNNGTADDYPVSSHKTFAVTPGLHTFALRARTFLSNVTFRHYDATCMYFPTRY